MTSTPTSTEVRRWRRYLAAERAEAVVYRELAARRDGTEREILLRLADAEDRHAAHWIELLGPHALPEPRVDFGSRLLGVLAKRFGSVFVLALMQRAEARSPYDADVDATDAMAADERVHGEVVRALASAKRLQLAGGFRAAVFGMNDGLVSNLALVLGVVGTGMPAGAVLATGVAGLLAGALSMAAGEYVSVSSQRELIDSVLPDEATEESLPFLDLKHNELSLVYRARGLGAAEADAHAAETIRQLRQREQALARGDAPEPSERALPAPAGLDGEHDPVGSAWSAAGFSFLCFAAGAFIPIIPYLIGATGWLAAGFAAALVGIALLVTGAITGMLSGAHPAARGLRQLGIGFGAALVTYLLGLLVGQLVL
ncbi:MAG TPA: VIT1/CCC1 family protein [Microbacteriaceae bacterium]|nr:VIT1/CCC1 family protein [Microbacteriaceae bacterium]